MPITNKPILITGGTGFVGSYIIRDLVERGYAVHAIRRRKLLPFHIDGNILSKVNWIDGDIMDTGLLDEAMKNSGAVVHAAANVSFSKKERPAMQAVNVEGTANVVNAAIENNIGRFVHISSVAAFGRSKNILVTEKQTWENNGQNTHYAVSKYRGEMEVWRGVGEGLNAVIVNPSTILGFGDWNTTSNALFKSVYNGFPWYSNGVNGFVDVQDVSRAVVTLMEADISSERFILNSENWSYHQLLDALADGFGKKRPNRLATPMLAGLAWRLEKLKSMITGKKTMLTKETAKVAGCHTEYNNAKILSALPEFHFRPLRETISETCAKYLQHPQV